MPIAIQPYTEDRVPAVKDFNLRLKTAGAFSDFLFFENHIPASLPRLPGRKIYEEYFVAIEGGSVRGAFAIKHQRFSFFGDIEPVGFYHFPLSEGIVDRAYTNVGIHMLRRALRDHPVMFALGMGGSEQPLPRMLKALGWSMTLVPFYFRVVRPFRFLRGMAELRRSAARRVVADLAAFSGLGSLGIQLVHTWKSQSKTKYRSVKGEQVATFGAWADDIWNSSRVRYSMIGERDQENLNILYPPDSKFIRLKITKDGASIGWIVLLDTRMRNNRHFGNLRVGSIVDCLALPENAGDVIRSGTTFLNNRSVDLIISNQSHKAWTSALAGDGFLKAPSNCVFATSPQLSALLGPFEVRVSEAHLNRGDGDGPIHL